MDGWIQNFRDTICLQMTAEQQKVWVYQNYQQVSYYQQMMAMQAQQAGQQSSSHWPKRYQPMPPWRRMRRRPISPGQTATGRR
mmetsp:Transcript_43449/g.136237  ORF Transcript_43449/g.136237 Transcript_43449/m.136237 type:complete len:83 (-) Transcript_43449:161-409(-)